MIAVKLILCRTLHDKLLKCFLDSPKYPCNNVIVENITSWLKKPYDFSCGFLFLSWGPAFVT